MADGSFDIDYLRHVPDPNSQNRFKAWVEWGWVEWGVVLEERGRVE